MNGYQLLDSGDGRKWERFGPYILCRPCPVAVWKAAQHIEADASFSRDEGSRWTYRRKVPSAWDIEYGGMTWRIAPTDFGHLGLFPEHVSLWQWMSQQMHRGDKVLNLFAYSGGGTVIAAQAGALVCHLDASKGMVDWAKDNALRNGLEKAPIRWIVDDAMKFLKREIKRGSRYEGILLDPPTFGRGSQGEVFKIEEGILPLLELCKAVLSTQPRFLVFSCHTPGLTPLVLQHLLTQVFGLCSESGEMFLAADKTFSIPSGAYARIRYD